MRVTILLLCSTIALGANPDLKKPHAIPPGALAKPPRPVAPPGEGYYEELSGLVAKMGSDVFAERQAATGKLRDYLGDEEKGWYTLRYLQQKLPLTTDAEVRGRMKNLVSESVPHGEEWLARTLEKLREGDCVDRARAAYDTIEKAWKPRMEGKNYFGKDLLDETGSILGDAGFETADGKVDEAYSTIVTAHIRDREGRKYAVEFHSTGLASLKPLDGEDCLARRIDLLRLLPPAERASVAPEARQDTELAVGPPEITRRTSGPRGPSFVFRYENVGGISLSDRISRIMEPVLKLDGDQMSERLMGGANGFRLLGNAILPVATPKQATDAARRGGGPPRLTEAPGGLRPR